MNSRNTINIVLFLFVASLIAILFIDSDNSNDTSFNLTTLLETDINSIEITRITSKPVKFEKKNNQWHMTSPYKVRANTYYIESLLRFTKAKSPSEFTISKQDKKKFRLEPPQATLSLNDQMFLFGTNEQLNLNRYILKNDKLYLILDRFFYILNIKTTGFIDHALIAKGEKIIRIKFANFDLKLLNDKWLTTPFRKNDSTDDIIQLITEWNNSQAIEIIDLNENTLYNKEFSIDVYLKDKTKAITFDIVKYEEDYLFVRPDLKIQYKLNNDMATRLLELNK